MIRCRIRFGERYCRDRVIGIFQPQEPHFLLMAIELMRLSSIRFYRLFAFPRRPSVRYSCSSS